MTTELARITIDRVASSTRSWFVVVALFSAAGCAGSPATSGVAQPAATTSMPPPGFTASVPVTVRPEPTGVPGLHAPDPFCAAWAAYSGTLQSLGIAASFGGLSSTDQAELELESVSSLVADIGEIGASWPTELSAERAAVLDQRIGPYERRAQRGVDALRAIGLGDDELAGVSAAWRSALAVRDPSVPVIDVAGLSDDVRAKLAAAATSYDAQVTPFGQDPSLVVDSVDAPATDAYLAAHCPDLAASGVGDSL